jgi:hypothetical protein
MNNNIKIQNIFDIVRISKSMEANSLKKLWKKLIKMFLMIFQSLMALGKSRCDVPNGITQRCFCPRLSGWVENLC